MHSSREGYQHFGYVSALEVIELSKPRGTTYTTWKTQKAAKSLAGSPYMMSLMLVEDGVDRGMMKLSVRG